MKQATPVLLAAWRHQEVRDGFEVVFVHDDDDGERLDGHVAAVEDAQGWWVAYEIRLDRSWRTRTATVSARSLAGMRTVLVEGNGTGRWLVDGAAAPHLDGCLDVDLEASVLTNAFPVRRLGLSVGGAADAPAVYVRAADVTVERLEQTYVRASDDKGRERYDYAAPAFGVECRLAYDERGLLLDYPGLATRVA
ncbi:MAG TPA: putative glycolipid-binding domain-containing protein [Mycobacterium sp.]|nr:putative glycolipid-binding domain-containing protein [Mycobacterium sp.]